MDIQRYRFYANNRDLRELRPEDDGDVVKYPDHLSALSKSQDQVVKMREAIIHLLADIANAEHERRPVSDFYIKLARSILGAKEEGREN